MDQQEHKKVYICPMHDNVQMEQPGLCPECGMNLVEYELGKSGATVWAKHDHDGKSEPKKHQGHSVNIFKTKFWISLILTVPVIAYSDLPQTLFNWSAPKFFGSEYLDLMLGSIVFFYGGWVFIKGAWRELRGRAPGMMTLIGLAIIAAYFFSVYSVFAGIGHTLFWELTSLIVIMLLGHWIEMRAVTGAQGALHELSKLLPDTAEMVHGEMTHIVALDKLKVGDVVLVRPGGKIPTDGIVIEGNSDLNEALITGEARPISKSIGDEVIAGTINGDGVLKIKVTKIGDDTFLAGVKRLIMEAQNSKSKLQLLSDRAAFYLTIIAVVIGISTFSIWLVVGAGIVFAIERLVAVLVITCPHALGLAVPLVASISTTMAAKNGLLIKQRLALEVARKVDTILFDKTGTLTRGEYGVEKIWAIDSKSENDILQIAASIDSGSEHFIAKAIVKESQQKNLEIIKVKNFERIPGKGVRAELNGSEIMLGSLVLAEEAKIEIAGDLKKQIQEESGKGKTVIYVLEKNKLLGALALGDVIRDESRQAIKDLKMSGLKIAMITGDSDEVAKWVAIELGIDEYFARVLPDGKAEKVKILQSRGEKVAMVGDGINDAPALTQADLGIAIGAGTNVAIESAGIILVKDDPRDIMKIIKLSKLTYRKMVQNLFWATGYNTITIPLAAGVLAGQGIVMQPAFAAILMSVSTVIVAINAVMLKKNKL